MPEERFIKFHDPLSWDLETTRAAGEEVPLVISAETRTQYDDSSLRGMYIYWDKIRRRSQHPPDSTAAFPRLPASFGSSLSPTCNLIPPKCADHDPRRG